MQLDIATKCARSVSEVNIQVIKTVAHHKLNAGLKSRCEMMKWSIRVLSKSSGLKRNCKLSNEDNVF